MGYNMLKPITKYWPSRHRLHATLLSLSLLSIALLTLWLGHSIPAALPDTIEVREVALTMPPPPPPPPPPVKQQLVETSLNLTVTGSGVVIPKIDVKHTIKPIKPDVPVIEFQQNKWQSLEINWDAFDLNQLDNLPTLLTPLRVSFPKSLSRKGISRILVKLDVVINEQGQLNLVGIIDNPYPELTHEIHRLVRHSRFTPPKKNNQNVRARFIWPVDIKS